MALYSPDTYDNFHPKYTRVQCSNGGKKRASTAKRDKWGRMLPKNDTVSIPEPLAHGVAGGKARMIKALQENKLDEKRRFTK